MYVVWLSSEIHISSFGSTKGQIKCTYSACKARENYRDTWFQCDRKEETSSQSCQSHMQKEKMQKKYICDQNMYCHNIYTKWPCVCYAPPLQLCHSSKLSILDSKNIFIVSAQPTHDRLLALKCG